MRVGRRSIGADVNELATFVSEVKTTVLGPDELDVVDAWISCLPDAVRHGNGQPNLHDWRLRGYLKDLDSAATWRLRTLIAHALDSLKVVDEGPTREFCRIVILRTAQWALDMRDELPSTDEFRAVLQGLAQSMLAAARRFSEEMGSHFFPPRILTQASPGLVERLQDEIGRPRLILTSPPYPGVYVLYHRWKMRGRREVAAPYWIADRNDGAGMSHYTMAARDNRTTFDPYFTALGTAYEDLRKVAGPKTLLVQMVGFNNVDVQLRRYLKTMNEAGFDEVLVPMVATAEDGRLWRNVPGRRWWSTTAALQASSEHTSREVVLIHQLAT